MEKRIQIASAVLMLMTVLTGCGAAKFENDYIEFAHPSNFKHSLTDSGADSFERNETAYFIVSLRNKTEADLTVQELAEFVGSSFAEAFGTAVLSIDYSTVDGTPSALITYSAPSYYSSMLVIDYSGSEYIVFSFSLSRYQDGPQIMQNIIDSIKLK